MAASRSAGAVVFALVAYRRVIFSRPKEWGRFRRDGDFAEGELSQAV